MKHFISAIVFLLSSAPLAAQDHLLPEESLFTGIYYERALSLLSSRLGRMYGPEAFANVVVLPSFSREYVIVFEKSKADEYKLVCMHTKQSMGSYQYLENLKSGRLTVFDGQVDQTEQEIARIESELPADYIDVEAVIVELHVDENVGRQLYKVWGRMLYETRYPKPESLEPGSRAPFGVGHDGTMHHFSFFHDFQPLSGLTWDYPANGRIAKLVELVSASKEACDATDQNVSRVLSTKLRAFRDND
ncbi:MAG: hypothetical protein AAFW68_05225 [Pseudomonadota bacterium]